MKKIIVVLCAVFLLFSAVIPVRAEEAYDLSGVYNSLSDEAKEHLLSLGADSADADTLSGLSLESILAEISRIGSQSAQAPFRGLISVTAMLLICSLLSSYKTSLSADIGGALNTVLALCVSAEVAVPAAGLIGRTGEMLVCSSNLMLAYIPVAALLLTASGSIAGSAAYYAGVLAMGEGIGQLSARIIVPFCNMLLGLGIAGGINSAVNLGGFTRSLAKTAKWLLGFGMALFTAVLGLKQVLSSASDSLTGRAAKLALSSFVPVVGSALGEALRTVQGSVTVLKSGIGVFVILALGVTFLPSILSALMWLVTLWAGKSTADALNLPQGALMLENIADVFRVMLAAMLSVMTVYIITTAMIFTMGGAA